MNWIHHYPDDLSFAYRYFLRKRFDYFFITGIWSGSRQALVQATGIANILIYFTEMKWKHAFLIHNPPSISAVCGRAALISGVRQLQRGVNRVFNTALAIQ